MAAPGPFAVHVVRAGAAQPRLDQRHAVQPALAHIGGQGVVQTGRQAALGQQLGQDAIVEQLAVRHHAVVVEDDQVVG
ncbi:hypothetical protein D3C85_1710590 [compost metagenome]